MMEQMMCQQTYERACNLHYKEHNLNDALEIYKQIIDEYPNSPEAGYSKSQITKIENMSESEKQRYQSNEDSNNDNSDKKDEIIEKPDDYVYQSITPGFSIMLNILGFLVPYRSYKITSTAPPKKIRARLSAATTLDTDRFLFGHINGKLFKGEINGEHFVLEWIESGKHYPVKIEGTVTQHGTGSRISIEISERLLIYFFIGIYTILLLCSFVERLTMSRESFLVIVFCPLLIYLIIQAIFIAKVYRIKKLLKGIIK